MGQIRHGCATTTHAVRAAIQRSQATNAALSRQLGINVKTVAKWRKWVILEDRKTGPSEPRSTVLTTDTRLQIAVRCLHSWKRRYGLAQDNWHSYVAPDRQFHPIRHRATAPTPTSGVRGFLVCTLDFESLNPLEIYDFRRFA